MTQAEGAPVQEFPDGDRLRAYGDFLFLAFRSPHHARMSVANLRMAIEPPLTHGQYRIFRFDGVARGLFTWAYLSDDAAAGLVAGGTLDPDAWRSGPNLWIMDLIAPYKGLTSQMVRWIMTPGNFTETEFFYRRVVAGNQTRRIVRIDLRQPDDKARVLRDGDFSV
ncbi:MAG: toxin-activating lysine-acyltransferase [Pseudomonadota bacterium]